MIDDNLTLEQWHRKQAVDNFNATWDMIDKKDRTIEDNRSMITTAHASYFHWKLIGTPLEAARGEWQISRVYSLLEMAESALFHGNNSLKLCTDNDIKDFDLAFGYEAVARGYMVSQEEELMIKYIDLAKEAAKAIEKKEDRDYFLSELNTIHM